MPVLPLVGSIIVAPGFKRPFFSASLIIANAILSLIEPAGLRYSSLAKILALVTPAFLVYPFNLSNGVFPINSAALSTYLLILLILL